MHAENDSIWWRLNRHYNPEQLSAYQQPVRRIANRITAAPTAKLAPVRADQNRRAIIL
jgi:hypothetical protein